MSGSDLSAEKPAEKIVRLMRQAAGAPTSGQITIRGDGNVFGDMITIHSGARSPRRADLRTLRAPSISFIRSICRRLGDPAAYHPFATAEFGTIDLEALTDTQLERVRGWCAAQVRA